MDLLIGLILSFIILLYSVIKGIYLGYSLAIIFLLCSLISRRKGRNIKGIIHSSWAGCQKSFVVLNIFFLIGLVTASWLSAGTIPTIVYYSMRIMNPRYFVVFAFLITSLVAYMLGTAFVTASTIGIVLIIMGRGGNINLNLVGGAILSGCFFGDRTSPMSSSANLVSNLTGAELYPMLKRFRRTTVIPFIVSTSIYLLFSFTNPLDISSNIMGKELHENFIINFVVLIPALIMLVLSIFQINVKKSMIISILASTLIALWIQGISAYTFLKNLVLGYTLPSDSPLSGILKGGGLVSMLKPSFIVFISCGIAGILEDIKLFDKVNNWFSRIKTRKGLFLSTSIVSIVTSVFGGNQSIAVVMTSQIMKNLYDKLDVDEYELATDISNTTILFAAMIPWNIANLVPATTLNVNPLKIVPYSFYLFMPPIINYRYLKIIDFKSIDRNP